MSIQDKINVFARVIYSECTAPCTIEENQYGALEAILARDKNGDIGFTTEREEITVYGLGGHQHFWSHMKKVDEIIAMKDEIIMLLKGLLNGEIAAYGKFDNRGKEIAGGYGDWSDNTLYLPGKSENTFTYVVNIHKDITRNVSAENVIVGRLVK